MHPGQPLALRVRTRSPKLLSELGDGSGERVVCQATHLNPPRVGVIAEYQRDAVCRSGFKERCWQWSFVILRRAGRYRFGEHCHRQHPSFTGAHTLDDNHESKGFVKNSQV